MIMPVMAEECMNKMVRELCDTIGANAYHTHDSRRSPAGFPDWTICVQDKTAWKGRQHFNKSTVELNLPAHRIVFAELKRADGRLSPAQANWIEVLRSTGQCGAFIVRAGKPFDDFLDYLSSSTHMTGKEVSLREYTDEELKKFYRGKKLL